MSVRRNVTLALTEVLDKSRDEANAITENLLRRFGLLDKIDVYPDQLSGGQQQRVAIVRALAMNPEVLLLDEITSALDPELVGEVLDIVRELKGSGITMLIATHEMAFARDISDRVCFLHAGRVAEMGPPEQVFTQPTDERTRQFLRRVL
jgi:polar amino acid transport system ATP-binding protein